MKDTILKPSIAGIVFLLCALPAALTAQAFGTTTVQGTVYLANGAAGSGTLQLSWPAFTTAANQAVAAGRTVVTIAPDGFVSVNLAPNAGATPAGLYYTAVYHLNDGTTSTEYWVVPSAAQATIAQVRATVMPAAQAVQAVSKTYVDQAISQAVQSQLTASGGDLTGPLFLNGDPGAPTQAATKHYVDSQFSQALSVNGGAANGPLTAVELGASFQADQFTGSDFGAKLQACINALNATYGGTCDARNFTGTLAMAANLTINKANVTVDLPCATISTASQIVVTAGTRNVTLHGCASRGTTAASGNQGGTVILYAGNTGAIQAGDAAYASDTLGFHLDNVVINTTASTSATARAIAIWRTQELHLEALYLLGNANQTGITLDGTGNYTGGTLTDVEIGGFQTAINAIGHQVANSAITDWLNASTFVRLHIDCPTTNGNPIAGTTGINLQQGDGNMFSGGDVESCATALHLGPNAQNNTIVGLRNENSTYQVVADAGSAYNNWMTGGTMFTGKLTDNGTRNSFLDTFHRSFNGINGDWYGSQQDATLTNHLRLGIGNGNERGLLNRYQTDYGYRWTTGLTDATAGEQYYQVLDELNNVNRLSIGQYNNGQGSSNNQTVVNAAGTGAVVLNGSNNAGSGGVVFGSGGPASSTVATINNAGNAQFNGTLQVSGVSTFLGSTTVKNQADAEIDAFLWAGATAPQKESVVYKDWNGNSQWYLVKDTSNNWALNSAVGGVDSFKAYQSNNSGDTYIDAANNAGVVRVNYEPGSGSAFNVYGGGSASLYASFNGTTGIKFPGLAAGSGKNCVQIDNSGYLSNTGAACAGSAVGAGSTGQIAYYPGNGSSLVGMSAVPVTAGGTGATSAAAALTSLGGLALAGGTLNGPLTLAGDPTANLQATTKQYVDAAFNGSANDQTARNSAGTAQSTANAAQSTANTAQSLANGALPANGCTNAGGRLVCQALDKGGAVFNVGAFGGKADVSQGYIQASMTSGSSTIAVVGGTWGTGNTEPQVGQYIQFNNNYAAWPSAPFASTPYVAQVTAVVDSNHVQITPTPTASFTAYIQWGTDNQPAAYACEMAARAVGGGTCKFGPGNWGLFSTPFYVLAGAQYAGDYGQPTGGSGATITATITNGAIGALNVMGGGSGYTANSALTLGFSNGCGTMGYEGGPCGWAWGYAHTNASGIVTSATITYPGYGFVTAPTVTVLPLGGDLAAATATMSGGAISSTTVTNAGSGYPASGTVYWYAINGTGCTPIQNQAGQAPIDAQGTGTTNSAGQVTSLTVGTNSSNCTSAPTIVFGTPCPTSSSTYGQCTNVTPRPPTKFPTHIVLTGGVNWEGNTGDSPLGVTVVGAWDDVTADNNEPWIFGGTLAYQSIQGMTLDGWLGVGATNNANYSSLRGLSFNTALGIYTTATDIGFRTSALSFNGSSGWVNGGTFGTRVNATNESGFFDMERIEDTIVRSYNSTNAAIDDWFANTFFLPQATAWNSEFPEVCKFPQSPNQLATGHVLYQGQGAFNICYHGITGIGLAIYARGARGTGAPIIENFTVKNAQRYGIYGDLGAAQVINAGCESCNTTGASDRYRTATTQEGFIAATDAGTSFPGTVAKFTNIGWSGSGTLQCMIFSISHQNCSPGARWWSAGGFGQSGADNPNFSNEINFPYGLAMTNNAPLDFWDNDSNRANYEGAWIGQYNGIMFRGPDHMADWLDIRASDITPHIPFYTRAGSYVCNGSAGFCALFSFTGTAARTVTIPDAASATVQPLGSATAGQFVQYIDGAGVQHLAATASGIALQTNGTNNGSQSALNIAAGSGIALSNSGGTVTVTDTNSTGTNADSVTCSNVSLSTTTANVCALTIPANRVPYGGVYEVNATCIAGIGSGGSASTFTPALYFYNNANTTKYALTYNNSGTQSITAGYGAVINMTGYHLVAPASGTGYNVAGGMTMSNRYDAGQITLLAGALTQSQSTATLVDSTGLNQIQVWMSTSVANTNPNTVSCTITGSVQH